MYLTKTFFLSLREITNLSKGGGCSTVVVTKGKGNMCYSGEISCIFAQITKIALRNHSLDEVTCFQSPCLSAKCTVISRIQAALF